MSLKIKTTNNSIKRNMRRVFWLMFALFVLLSGYFVKLVVFDAGAIVTNPYNRRLYVADNSLKRGSIFASGGEVLAESLKNADGVYVRSYPEGELGAHAVGFATLGGLGVERGMNFKLQSVNFEIFQRLIATAGIGEAQCTSLKLTIDLELQKAAAAALGGRKGAVVILEPGTGIVLAMVSTPGFDPNRISESWSELNASEDAPLLNRAINGLYEPGSTFKIVMAIAAINAGIDDFEYTCTGKESFDGKTLHCYNGVSHGKMDLSGAFENSCNTYFAKLGEQIAPEEVAALCDSLKLTALGDYQNLPLEYSVGSYALTEGATASEVVETAIGQGKTLVSPLGMAMLAACIANDGVMMEPVLIDSLESVVGGKIKQYMPRYIGSVLSEETCTTLQKMMRGVVVNGTGKKANISGFELAGKTGTAETGSGEDHSWFVGFAPYSEPKYAFAVILENGGSGSATDAVRRIFESAHLTR